MIIVLAAILATAWPSFATNGTAADFCASVNWTTGYLTAYLAHSQTCLIYDTGATTKMATWAWPVCAAMAAGWDRLGALWYQPRTLGGHLADWLAAKALLGTRNAWLGVSWEATDNHPVFCEPCGKDGDSVYLDDATDHLSLAGLSSVKINGQAGHYNPAADQIRTLLAASNSYKYRPACQFFTRCPLLDGSIAGNSGLNVSYNAGDTRVGTRVTVTCGFNARAVEGTCVQVGADAEWVWDDGTQFCEKPMDGVVTAGQGLSAVIRAGEWGVSSFGNETAELGSVSVVMCGTRCLRNPHCWGANLGPLIGEKVSCTAILRYVTGTMTAPTGAHGFLEFQLPTL